ncbi:MAG: hypothetical protein II776_03120 [Clostridia bacterium]|nr:hypothetical protein [Clostridia bacterium]
MKGMKILSLLLALVMLLTMAACAKGEEGKGGPVDVVKNTEEEDTSHKYESEIHDMHGHEFWFIVRSTTYWYLDTNEIYAEELNGDKVNDAVFKRNAQLEQAYNCKIREERSESPASAVREQLLAGEYQYDFIYDGITRLRPLSAAGLLVDFYELEEIDLSKAWWDMNAIQGLSIAGKAFYVTGGAGTMDERASWIMYFNKDVIEKYRLEDPYELVRQGKWTIDKMYEYVSTTWEDLDGDGVLTIGKDRMGYTAERNVNWYHVAACNVKLSRMSKGGDIEIPGTVNEDVLRVWTKLRPLLTTEYRDVADAGARFSNGLSTFFALHAGGLLSISQHDLNFGVLPMPKYDEEQEEYWTSIHPGWCGGFAIPTATDNAPDYQQNGFSSGREQAGYFLEAFSYYSDETLTVAFYDQVMKRQTVKDVESPEMLDLALKNKVYDPVVIFDFGQIGLSLFMQAGSNGFGGTGAPAGVTAKGSDVNYDTLVSTYEARLKAARKALNNYVNYITADD